MYTCSIGKYRYPVKQQNPKDSNILKEEMSGEYKKILFSGSFFISAEYSM